MYWIKQLFEGSLTLRDYDGQVAEATCAEQHGEGRYARKRAYCLKIQPATGTFAQNLIYSTKPGVAGSLGGKVVDSLSPVTDQVTKDVISAVTGSTASELTGQAVKDELDKRKKKQ